MNARHWLSLALVALVMAMTFLRKTPTNARYTTVTNAATPRVLSKPLVPAATQKKAPALVAPSPAPWLPVNELKPSREEIRTAALANPHATPLPLLRFSVEIYRRLAAAKISEATATNFFAELALCVNAEDVASVVQVRAVCLLNAKRLQALYPSLRADYDRLELNTAPSVLRLVDNIPL